MPRGDVHDTASGVAIYLQYLASRPLVGGGFLSEDVVIAYMTGFAFGAYLVTPDLDLAGEKPVRPLRHWGPFRAIWLPYGRLSKHRGLSHTWLVGPLTRIVYLLIVLSPLGVGFWALEARGWLRWQAGIPVRLLAAGFLGYLAAQWLHLVLDALYTRGRAARNARRG